MMKRFRFLTLAALLTLPLAACDEGGDTVAPAAGGSVTGLVTVDGTAASGVTVTLSSGATTTTDASGRYTFADVALGAYTVTISGYDADVAFPATTKAAVVATSGQSVAVDFAGSRIRTAAIFGAVTTASGPVVGATVTLSGPETKTIVTDANGQYSQGGLRAGTYTVAVSNLPATVTCATSSKSVTVAAGENKVASFSCAPNNTSSISGRLFLDENDKNNVDDGPTLEESLMVANVAITLEGPTVGMTQTTQTNADGTYSFNSLAAGSYNVTIATADPDLPSSVTYGGTSATKAVTLAGSPVTGVSFPFDIKSQTVKAYAFLGRDANAAAGISTSIPTGVAPIEGVILELYPTEADAIGMTNRLSRDTTNANGEVQFTFDREDDTSPGGGNDRIVFATYVGGPDAYHTLNGESRIEIQYDARMATDLAADTFDMLNTRVVLNFDAVGAGGGAPLSGWAGALWLNDTTAAATQSTASDANGKLWFSDAVAATSLPDTFYLRLSGTQVAAAGHAFTQDPVAERGSTVKKYLRFIHNGVVMVSDTVDVGDEVVTFLDADLLVRAYHEQDDSLYGGPAKFTAGDNVENADNIQVMLSWRQTGAVTDSMRTLAASSIDGTATFANVPTMQGPYMLKARSLVSTEVVLMDTLMTVGDGTAGDLDGSTMATLACPLGNNTFAACGTFAYKYTNGSITGTVRAADGTDADGIKVRVMSDPRTIQAKPMDTTLVVSGGAYNLGNVREGYYIVSVADSVTTAGDSVWAFLGVKSDTVDVEGNADNDIVSFTASRMDTQIKGVVVNDRDVDLNTVDPGEALAGVTLELYRDGSGAITLDTLVKTTTTDANGQYTFSKLREGTYAVRALSPTGAVVLRSYTALGAKVDTAVVHTAAAPAPAGSNADNLRTVGSHTPNPLPRWDYATSAALNVNPSHFTFLYSTTTATGRVATTVDDTSVVGMTMTLTRCDDSPTQPSPPAAGACTTYFPGFAPMNQATNSGGMFTFSNLEEGVYEVRSNPATAGRASTTPASILFTLSGNNDVETGDFAVP